MVKKQITKKKISADSKAGKTGCDMVSKGNKEDVQLSAYPQDTDGTYWLITSDRQLELYLDNVRKTFDKNKCITATVKSGKKRTLLQNAALHVYCFMLGKKMDDGGIDMISFFKVGAKIPWTTLLVKETIWKPVQKAIINKSSTTDAQSSEYGKVYEVLNRHLASEYGLHVPWPVKNNERN